MKKLDGILISNFLCNIFYTATYPYIYKQIYTNISEKLLALCTIITCVSVIVFSNIYNKHSQYLYKFFPLFCLMEFVCSVSITLYMLNTYSYSAYYLLDTFIGAVITRNIFCGINRLKVLRYNSQQREKFDNSNNAWCSAGTIIGSLIAMILNLPFSVMLWIATFGNAIDNLSYIFIYYKTGRKIE